MKYQLSDLINGAYGKIYDTLDEAEAAYDEAVEEGKRLNLENSDGDSDRGSDDTRVEDFIFLIEMPDEVISSESAE
jgi:hypothetical protein